MESRDKSTWLFGVVTESETQPKPPDLLPFIANESDVYLLWPYLVDIRTWLVDRGVPEWQRLPHQFIKKVVSLLSCHAEEVFSEALWIVKLLTHQSSFYCEKMVRLGVVPRVLKMLDSWNLNTVHLATQALLSLALVDMHTVLMSGAIESVTRLVERMIEMQQTQKGCRVLYTAVFLFGKLLLEARVFPTHQMLLTVVTVLKKAKKDTTRQAMLEALSDTTGGTTPMFHEDMREHSGGMTKELCTILVSLSGHPTLGVTSLCILANIAGQIKEILERLRTSWGNSAWESNQNSIREACSHCISIIKDFPLGDRGTSDKTRATAILEELAAVH